MAKIIDWLTHLGGWCPSSGKSWIRHPLIELEYSRTSPDLHLNATGESVATLSETQTFGVNIRSGAPFTATIYYVIAILISIRLKNGLCYHFYHPQTKLRKGNVFTGICHSVRRGWGGVGDGGWYITCIMG